MSFTPCPKPAPREKKPRKPLPRNTKPIARFSWLKPSSKKIPERNEQKRARREKAYRKFIGSSVWKAIRQATFELQDYSCVLCPYVDESRTGNGLVCDHLTYRRFGGQEIVGEDTRTLCRTCDRKQTKETRANWFGRPFRKSKP
jgi:5-methylcytosine-specific restriction endonuclease McrA